jgi:hypothetical protein
METKKSQLINAFSTGNIKKALKIAKGFTREFTKDQQRSIQIAYECLTGKESYYQQLGINTNQEKEKAKTLLSVYA